MREGERASDDEVSMHNDSGSIGSKSRRSAFAARERDRIILLEFDMVLYNWSSSGGVENNKHVRRG